MRPALLGLAVLMTACGPSEPGPPATELRQTPAPAPAWTMHSITLYLPAPVIERRISSGVLAEYIRELQTRASTEFASRPVQRGVSGAVVVMVKPGGKARAWIATGEPIESNIRAEIETAMAAIAPPEVTGGPVVFGLLFSAWGGGEPPPGLPMPTPDSWKVLSADGGRLMDDRFYEEAWAL